MSCRPRLDQTSAELLTAGADSAIAEPRLRRWLTRWFEAWLEKRAAVAQLPPHDGARYVLAKSALWHDHVTEEDGHGMHQVIGTTDRMLLELVDYARRVQRAAAGRPIGDDAVAARHGEPNRRRR